MTETNRTGEIRKIVRNLVRESLAEAPDGGDVRDDSALIGDGAIIDSVGLVILIVALEEQLEAAFGRPILLSGDPDALAPEGPFSSVSALVAHLDRFFED